MKEDYFTSTVDGAMGFENMYGRQYEDDAPSLYDLYEGEECEEDDDEEWFYELLERRKKIFKQCSFVENKN